MTPRVKRWSVIATAALVVVASIGYAVFLGELYFRQERLIFPGRPLAGDFQFQFDQRFEEVRIPVPGATLHALHFMQERPRGLVFFLHGNAANLQTWTTGIDFYRRVNYDLFIVDYRGYGKSTGHIESEDGAGHNDIHRFPNYLDALAAWLIAAGNPRDGDSQTGKQVAPNMP